MTSIYKIIEELNLENGSNYKKEVLTKYKDNELLKQVLKMTYDTVAYTYGITTKGLREREPMFPTHDMQDGIELLKGLHDRKFTGNRALFHVAELLDNMSDEMADVFRKILDRDLRINLGKTHINKVFPKLIVKPPYMRCSLKDKLDRITYPALVQEKADGTYRSLEVKGGVVSSMGRSGEPDNFPTLYSRMSHLPDGVYIGELLLRRYPGKDNRLKANGLINSDVEQDDMYIQCWDYITLDEWENALSKVDYVDRFAVVQKAAEIDSDYFEAIDSVEVNSLEEAMEYYRSKVAQGFEGAVLKNKNTPFKNHTSPTQIKLKEEAIAEFIVKDYQEGEGRLVGTLGAMYYESQDGLVKGKMSGFTDAKRKDIWNKQDKYMNTIVSVKYNGVTKAENKDTYALMFATFVEFRPEKDLADDLDYIVNALK